MTKLFDFRPAAIIETLDLLRPIYRPTAAYGHFGRKSPKGKGWFTWERTDRAGELAEAVLFDKTVTTPASAVPKANGKKAAPKKATKGKEKKAKKGKKASAKKARNASA